MVYFLYFKTKLTLNKTKCSHRMIIERTHLKHKDTKSSNKKVGKMYQTYSN